MRTYSQRTGVIMSGNKCVGVGYSGFGTGKNNPGLESVRDLGPIPRGMWRIVRWDNYYPGRGLIVAVLEPVGHEAFHRSGFLIHGDSIKEPGTASHGCIICSRKIRDEWRESGDADLEVIE